MNMKYALSAILFTLCNSPVWAQECDSTISASMTANRFQQHRGGTIIDTRTRLQWQRCSLGQHWNGASCQGKALLLTQRQAQEKTIKGWRLPTLHELSGIAELRCSQPAINLDMFPDTPADDFWTATVFANSSGVEAKYWQVQFIYGETNLGGAKNMAYVRLVKNTD